MANPILSSHKPIHSKTTSNNKSKRQQQAQPKPKPNTSPSQVTSSGPSWSVIKNILSCKHVVQTQVQQPQTPPQNLKQKQLFVGESSNSVDQTKRYKKMKCSGSICDNTKVMQRPELLSSIGSSFHTITSNSSISDHLISSNSSSSNKTSLTSTIIKPSISNSSNVISSSNSNQGSGGSNTNGFKGMPFRRFTGCYECRMVVDPVVLGFIKDPSLRSTVCSCPDCGEVFMKAENLETHQSVKHAGNKP